MGARLRRRGTVSRCTTPPPTHLGGENAPLSLRKDLQMSVASLLDEASCQALTEVASRHPTGLIIVTAPAAELATAAVEALAPQWVGPEQVCLVATPDSDRWTVAELEVKVRLPARAPAPHGRLIVVDRADAADKAATDHLLVALETPALGVTVVLTAAALHEVAPTLRSRAALVLALQPAPVECFAAALTEAGLDPERAARSASALWPFGASVQRLADLPEPARTTAADAVITLASAPATSETPFADADALASQTEAIPALLNDPSGKAAARDFARLLLAAWRTQTQAALSAPLTATTYRQLHTRLRALDEGERGIGAYLPLRSVFLAARAPWSLA